MSGKRFHLFSSHVDRGLCRHRCRSSSPSPWHRSQRDIPPLVLQARRARRDRRSRLGRRGRKLVAAADGAMHLRQGSWGGCMWPAAVGVKIVPVRLDPKLNMSTEKRFRKTALGLFQKTHNNGCTTQKALNFFQLRRRVACDPDPLLFWFEHRPQQTKTPIQFNYFA